MISAPTKDFAASMFALWAPPPRYNVAQWAEAKREIPRGASAEPGKWRNSRLPYLTEIMESFTDPKVSETILMMGVQLGKTETLINAILYVMDADPAGVMVKYPTKDKAKAFSIKKLTPAIRGIPTLKGKIRDPRTRDSGNTQLSKTFPGGFVELVGANSVSSLRGSSARWIIQDEIDADAPNPEGDPVSQCDGRAENFHDAVFIKASTPTIKGQSRIAALYESSDQRQWHCPCPKCGHWQTLKWAQVRWSWNKEDGTRESDPSKAAYVCEKCLAELSDYERVRMVFAGKWIPKYPERTRRGYAMSGLYRIMGKKSKAFKSYLHQFVVNFLESKDDETKLQFWTNTFLNETWELKLAKLDTLPIMNRCEPYGPSLPKKVLVLTCAVDVQQDRLEYEVVGWGINDESWGIRAGRINGDPLRTEVWKGLDEFLQKTYDHPLLGPLKPVVTVIDVGGNKDGTGFADAVYRYVRPRQPNEIGPGVYAIKGAATYGSALVSNRRPKDGVCLKLIGTDTGKSTAHARLKLEHFGPRYMHFPVGFGYDEEYFLQLGAEAPRTVKKRGYSVIQWHKLRDRNEALDLRVYSLAAIEILNADMLAISMKAKALDKSPETEEPKAPAAVSHARMPKPQLRRPPIFRPRFRR